MSARRSVLLQILAVVVAVAMSACVLPFLRQPVAIHWNLLGQPDAWGSPAIPLLLMPALLGGLVAASFALAHRGRANRELLAGMALVSGLFLAIHGMSLWATAFHALFPVRPLLALAFGFFAGIAPIVARVEQNPWFGVRTPWTLGSRRVWKQTHRATGRLWLVGGIVGSALTLFGAPLALVLLFLVGLVLAPVAISYSVWQRLGRP